MKKGSSEIDPIEVARYYIGYGFRYKIKSGEEFESVLHSVTNSWEFFGFDSHDVFMWHDDIVWYKPILKHVNNITKKDKRQYYNLCKTVAGNITVDTPASIHFLIKNGYDAFGLIDKGDAINIKK